jgi:hypothetical protein
MTQSDKNKAPGQNATGRHEHPLPQEVKASEKAAAEVAHEQAEHDIEEDPDFSAHSPNDDLDEGETARLGGDEIPLI